MKEVVRNVWRRSEFSDCGYRYKIKLPFIIKHFFVCIKWSHQRITRGYCDKDIWDMFSYLQSLLPDMLQQLKDTRNGSPGFLGENYVNAEGLWVNDTCHEEWDKILDEMIFLWHESDELACSVKNEFEDEYMKAFGEYNEKYGTFGERLPDCNKSAESAHRIHFLNEVDEYKDISDKYDKREKEIERYREKCKNKAFDMLKEYFFCLWD